MWATLALASALSLAPNQAGVQLVNPRVTYGPLGPTRAEEKLLPGDIYFLEFDIDGLKTKNGEVTYSIGLEIVNPKDKSEFKREPDEFKALLAFGGSKIPGHVGWDVLPETAPGTYTLKVNVADKVGNTAAKLERKFEVLPKGALGIVRLAMYQRPFPPAGGVPVPAPAIAFPGQAYSITFQIVGFQKEKDPKRENKALPNIAIAFTVLDEKDKPVADPWKDELNRDKLDEKIVAIPIDIPVDVTRAGKFTLKVEVTDLVAKKTTTVTFPLTVMDIK